MIKSQLVAVCTIQPRTISAPQSTLSGHSRMALGPCKNKELQPRTRLGINNHKSVDSDCMQSR